MKASCGGHGRRTFFAYDQPTYLVASTTSLFLHSMMEDLPSAVTVLWSIHGEVIGWPTFWILLFSSLFVYAASAASRPVPLTVRQRAPPPVTRRKVQLKKVLEAERRVRAAELTSPSRTTFPFLHLPPELQLSILTHCADSPQSYRALSLVSRYTHASTLRACLPHLPITLLTTRALSSFVSLLQRHIHIHPTLAGIGTLVRRLWVTPISENTHDRDMARAILAACPRVRVLACDAQTLTYAVGLAPRHRHLLCTHLTLLMSNRGWDVGLASTPNGARFLRQLTHLRVMGEQLVPSLPTAPLTRLTHLSYAQHTRPTFLQHINPSSHTHVQHTHPSLPPTPPLSYPPHPPACDPTPNPKPHTITLDPAVFPSLRLTIVTRRCDRQLPQPHRFENNLVLLLFPSEMTEMELWRGKTIWDQAENALPAANKS